MVIANLYNLSNGFVIFMFLTTDRISLDRIHHNNKTFHNKYIDIAIKLHAKVFASSAKAKREKQQKIQRNGCFIVLVSRIAALNF